MIDLTQRIIVEMVLMAEENHLAFPDDVVKYVSDNYGVDINEITEG